MRTEAQAQAQRRDALLRRASLGDAAIAWRALHEALTIDPGYPGLADREAQTLRPVLPARRRQSDLPPAGGTPPGLYWMAPVGETQYLPRSDEDSRLRGIAPDGRGFLYDAAPMVPPYLCRQTCLPGRQIMWSSISADGVLTTRPIYTPLPSEGQGVFTADDAGFWWIAGAAAWYFDGATATLTALPTSDPPRQLLAVDPVRKRVLLSSASAGDTMLYLAQVDGTDPRPLLIVQDRQVVSAVFSADGTRVICTMQKVGAEVSRTVWLVNVPEEDTAATQVVVLDWIAWAGLQTVARLNAFAAPAGPILIDLMDQGGEEVAQVDPRTGVRTILWTGAGQVRHYEAAAISPDGRILAFHDAQEHKSTLVVLPLDGSARARTFPSPSYGNQTIDARALPPARITSSIRCVTQTAWSAATPSPSTCCPSAPRPAPPPGCSPPPACPMIPAWRRSPCRPAGISWSTSAGPGNCGLPCSTARRTPGWPMG